MEFFDCNVTYGVPAQHTPLRPVNTVEELVDEMRRAGVSKAVVKREEVFYAGPQTGNQLVASDIARFSQLFGLWAIVPPQTHELPSPEEILQEMKNSRIVGWLCWPKTHRYSLKEYAMGRWFEVAEDHRVPIFTGQDAGVDLDQAAAILAEHPDLRLVWLGQGVWPDDRLIRPLLDGFGGFHLDLSRYMTDGGIEGLVEEYGAQQLLFGSGFYQMYFGAGMLMIQHSEISSKDKELISGGNMERLVREVRYD